MNGVYLEVGSGELLVPIPFVRDMLELVWHVHEDLRAGGWRALYALITTFGLHGEEDSRGIIVRAGDSVYVVELINEYVARIFPGNACGGRCRMVRTGRPVLTDNMRVSTLIVDSSSADTYGRAVINALVFDLEKRVYTQRVLDPLADVASICTALGTCESAEQAYTAAAKLAAGDTRAVSTVERLAAEVLSGAGCGGVCLSSGGVTTVRIDPDWGSLERAASAASLLLDSLDSVARVRESIADKFINYTYDPLSNAIYNNATGFPSVAVRGGRVLFYDLSFAVAEYANTILASNIAYTPGSFAVECGGERGLSFDYKVAAQAVSDAVGVELRPLACSGARVCSGGGCFELHGDNIVIAASNHIIVPLTLDFEYVFDASELYAAEPSPLYRDTLAIRVARPDRPASGFDYLAAGRGSTARRGLAACGARDDVGCAISYADIIAESRGGGFHRVARTIASTYTVADVYGFECVSKLMRHIIETTGARSRLGDSAARKL